MMEDFKKNFVLLSTVAKEKKYAQEYLGLLARRGDIGSIRIGKRWYTTMEWFSEFLADAEAKKAEVKNMKIEIEPVEKKVAEVIKIEKVFFPGKFELKQEVKLEKVSENLENQVKAEKMSLRIGRELPVIDLRKIASRGNPPSPSLPAKQARLRRASQGTGKLKEKLEVWNNARGASPVFLPDRDGQFSFFPKLAFSMSVVLLLVLLIQFGWVYKNELKRLAGIESGVVAGAENIKLNLAVVKNSSLGYLENQGDKVKENISLSRALIRAAMEREK